nr:DUF3304 domain-containing protein [Pseudomonas aeruginosa]
MHLLQSSNRVALSFCNRLGFLFLQACQAGPDMVSTPIGGYNHTSVAINRFSVNGAGGLNLGPFQGEQGRYVVVSFLEFGSRA